MHGNFPNLRRARIVRRDDTWTYVESEILRKHWPDLNILAKLLPHRKATAMRHMAKRCGLIPDKVRNVWTGAQDKKLRQMASAGATRKDIAAELSLSVGQVANRPNYRRINLARRPPKPYGDPLIDEVRRRAFSLNISAAELDRSLGDRRIFQAAWKGRHIGATHIHRAVKALGGVLKVEWIDE